MKMPSENNPLSMEYQTMSNIPAELKYVASHEWLRLEEDGTITVGITHHAQELLGDIVFVELPEVGANLAAEEQAGVVESVKAASDVLRADCRRSRCRQRRFAKRSGNCQQRSLRRRLVLQNQTCQPCRLRRSVDCRTIRRRSSLIFANIQTGFAPV